MIPKSGNRFSERDHAQQEPPSELHPAVRRRAAWMERAALLAGARLRVGIERFVKRRQVFHQMLDPDLDAMDERAAREAIPFEPIDIIGSRRFHHEPDRAWLRPL